MTGGLLRPQGFASSAHSVAVRAVEHSGSSADYGGWVRSAGPEDDAPARGQTFPRSNGPLRHLKGLASPEEEVAALMAYGGALQRLPRLGDAVAMNGRSPPRHRSPRRPRCGQARPGGNGWTGGSAAQHQGGLVRRQLRRRATAAESERARSRGRRGRAAPCRSRRPAAPLWPPGRPAPHPLAPFALTGRERSSASVPTPAPGWWAL